MPIGRFIGAIAALIWNPEDETYLLLRRSDHKDVGAGKWECITGRLDEGEGFADALPREVREELNIPIRLEFPMGTGHTYRGDKRPENEMLVLHYFCTTSNPAAITIGVEHSEYHWMTADEAFDFLPPDNWLHILIRRAESLRPLMTPELRAFYHHHGF